MILQLKFTIYHPILSTDIDLLVIEVPVCTELLSLIAAIAFLEIIAALHNLLITLVCNREPKLYVIISSSEK